MTDGRRTCKGGQELMRSGDDWVGQLETNDYGVRILTLHKAFQLAAESASAGWYIAPYALKWTVGRAASGTRRYHVILDGEPMTFETVEQAFAFLTGMLGLTGTQIHTALPQSPA